MRRFQIAILAAMMPLFLWAPVRAAGGTIDQVIASETGLTYNNQYPLDISDTQNLSMQVAYTSTTFASQTFSDGTQSTGNITVVSYLALSTASATAQVTITSNTALANQTLFIAGTNIPFRVDVNFSSNTACNAAADITAQTVFTSTCNFNTSSGIIYSTSPVGSRFNTFSIQSSSLAAISSAAFSGGQDNQSFTVNGKRFVANTDFYPLTSIAQTATNIATAMTNSSSTINVIASAGAAGVVFATSTVAGSAANYALASSKQMSLAVSSPVVTNADGSSTGAMTGGTNVGYSLTTSKISITNHGFTKALPVLLSTGGATIGPLVNQTTYYVVILDPNTIGLSSTSAVAQTGNFITLTSSSTGLTSHTLTLAPLAISGTPSFKWQVSNDNADWSDLLVTAANVGVTTVSMGSYVFGSTTTVWDLGQIDYQKIRLNVTGPTQGGILLKAYVHGKGR